MYDPLDPELIEGRRKARLLFHELNQSRDDQTELRTSLLKKLIPNSGEGLWIEPPFYCDYGENILLGDRVFFNFNCVILDVCKVEIGSRCMFAPGIQIYTATHPLEAEARSSGRELGKPIKIGDDVWVGGAVVICPGVEIGDRAVIGAGSVVTRDIPADVFAAGNPCRVVKTIEQ